MPFPALPPRLELVVLLVGVATGYNLAMQILISGGPAEEAQGVVAEGLKLGVDFPPLWLLQGQIHLTRAPGEVAADVDRYLAAGGRPQPEMYLLLWQGAARAGLGEKRTSRAGAGVTGLPRRCLAPGTRQTSPC